MLHDELDRISEELNKLTKEDLRAFVQKLKNELIQKIDTLIDLGTSASPSQVLVVVLAWPMSEEKLTAYARAADDTDKQVLKAIREILEKAHVHFLAALASLGKVKEWSASLEISASGLFVKGTGGISVTFGR